MNTTVGSTISSTDAIPPSPPIPVDIPADGCNGGADDNGRTLPERCSSAAASDTDSRRQRPPHHTYDDFAGVRGISTSEMLQLFGKS